MGSKDSGTPKADLLCLDGTQITDGEISKTNFFDFLKMDLADYSNVKLTPDQALKFRNHVVRMTHGVAAAIPLLCSGTECPNKICPLHEGKSYPLTQPCIVETRMIQLSMANYVEDLGVDTSSITQMVQVNKLVELDIKDYRANLGLSGGTDEEAATLLKTTTMIHGEDPIETVNPHPLLEIQNNNQRLRMQLLEALVATQREKYKKAAALKQSEGSDASKYLAELKKKIDGVSSVKEATSFDKIKQDAKEVAEDPIIDADWQEDGL